MVSDADKNLKYKLSSFGETKRLLGIDDTLIDELLYNEKLYIYDENGKRVGRFFLNIENLGTIEDIKLLYVHLSNRAFINGKVSESIVTATITSKLKTVEEIRYERSEMAPVGKHERTMFLLREDTKYYVSVTNKLCDSKSKSYVTIPFVKALGLIGEGSNAILLRKLAVQGYEGILCLKTILSNGKQCKNYYVTKLSKQIINGEKLQVLVVYRNITNHKKYNNTMTLALTRAGQLIYLFWSNSKYFLHVDPDAYINTRRYSFPASDLSFNWHRDVQLYSMYLDRVDQNLLKYRTYRYENEALGRILLDFVTYVLINKPTDVICFAISYFSAFGHNSLRKCRSKVKVPKELICPPINDLAGEEEENFISVKESLYYGEI